MNNSYLDYSIKNEIKPTRNSNNINVNNSIYSHLNTSSVDKNEQSKLKHNRSLRQILHYDIDFYLHSQKVFEALNNLRSFPLQYIEQLDSLNHNACVDNSGAFIKINKYCLRCTKYDIEDAKEFLIKIAKTKKDNKNHKGETIMWNEKLQHLGMDIIKHLSNSDYSLVKQELDQRISSALSFECESIDFILYDYMDPILSIFVILIENPSLREKLLCNNYHFGSVSCGSFKEVASVILIFLVNRKKNVETEEEYLELDLNDKILESISYKDQIKEGIIIRTEGTKHFVNFCLMDGSIKEEVLYYQ